MLRWAGKSGSMLGHSLEGEKNEKTICSIGSGMSDSGSDGGAGLGADGQGGAAKSGGKSELRVGRRKVGHCGLLESAREGAKDFWRIGPLWRSLARRSQ